MSNARRILITASLVLAVSVVAGCTTRSGQGDDHPAAQRSYRDARQLVTRAGFTVTHGDPKLATSWPAVIREHCTAMLIGFYGHTAADTVQTWVCKSPADAKALKDRLASEPGNVTVPPAHKTGAARYSTRQNLIFFVMADSHVAAAKLTHALQRS